MPLASSRERTTLPGSLPIMFICIMFICCVCFTRRCSLNAENYFVADCLFCKIRAGQMQNNIVYQDEDVLAFQDIQPQAPHHVLIIPRRHFANSLSDLKKADEQILLRLFDAATQIAG